VTVVKGRNRILAAVVVIVLIVIVYAWLDGGEEPLREISEPVPVPEMPA